MPEEGEELAEDHGRGAPDLKSPDLEIGDVVDLPVAFRVVVCRRRLGSASSSSGTSSTCATSPAAGTKAGVSVATPMTACRVNPLTGMWSGVSRPATRTIAGADANLLECFPQRRHFGRLVRLDAPSRQRDLIGVMGQVRQPAASARRCGRPALLEEQQQRRRLAIAGPARRQRTVPASRREAQLRALSGTHGRQRP